MFSKKNIVFIAALLIIIPNRKKKYTSILEWIGKLWDIRNIRNVTNQ